MVRTKEGGKLKEPTNNTSHRKKKTMIKSSKKGLPMVRDTKSRMESKESKM
jgi:hypothetical protein